MTNKSRGVKDSRMFQELKSLLFLILGCFSIVIGIKLFLLQRNILDAGLTGISMLLSYETQFPLYVFILLFNLPLLFIIKKQYGSRYISHTFLGLILLNLGIALIPVPNIQNITKDIWLISVFGGVFIGGGIGLALRGYAILDGFEIVTTYISKKLKITHSDVQISINVLFFLLVAIVINIETAMYSVLTFFTTMKTTEYVVEGIEEYMGISIVSIENQRIIEFIVSEMGRGATVYHGTLGYGKLGQKIQDTHIIYTVITKLELNKLTEYVLAVDKDAFMSSVSVKEIRGGIIKKRAIQR